MDEQLSEKKRDRSALGWFALGALVGAVALAGVLTLSGALRLPSGAAAGAEPDLAAIREAARLGAQDALQENATGTAGAVDLSAIRKAAQEGAETALAAQLGAGSADSADSAGDAAAPPANAEAVKNVTTREQNTLGDANAPVTLIEYSDYQCPFCLRFHTTVYPEIIEKYVKSGKVRFTFKHFPFLSAESGMAAQASECAADQNRFWDYHELLYKEREKAGQLSVTKDTLIEFAGQLNLDKTAFAACLNEDQTLARVQADSEEGQNLGVRGTPSFLINDKLLVGAQPLAAFEKAIGDALAGKQ